MKLLRWITAAALLFLGTVPVLLYAAEKAALLIDVRTEAEWKEGHLAGAILIPYDRIGEEIAKVAPDKKLKIHLYCRSGRRSGIALDTLKKSGYEDVTNFGSVREASDTLNIPIIKDDR